MTAFRVRVSEEVLIWARRSNGLSTEEAARKIKVSEVELRLWEEGVEDPPIEKLRDAARAYKYPLAVLLLPRPPRGIEVLRDFRLLPGNKGQVYSPSLQQQFRRIQYQQEIARELAASEGISPPVIEIAINLDENPEKAAQRIRTWVLEERSPERLSHEHPDLREFISLVEQKGVLVTQVEGVDIAEMRGCAFSASLFPAIVLNGKDSSTGKLFTLAHELVHLLLHERAICDLNVSETKFNSVIGRIERFCDLTAAAALLPAANLRADPDVARGNLGTQWTVEQLMKIAEPFHVSPEAMLRRLVTLGKASVEYYWLMRPLFAKHYQELHEREVASQTSRTGGPNPYVLKIRNFGRRFVSEVLDAYDQDVIELSDVSDYLDIKVNNIHKLVERMAV